jgi:TetR/AcrR family transcriptional repressor of bet genes
MPRIVDHPERRAAFAEAAIDTIGQQGLESLRLRDVAARANATTGALTHYFDGKDELLQAALEAIMERLLDWIDSVPEHQAGEDAIIDAIAAGLPITPEDARDWRVWLAFWGRAVASQPLGDAHRAHYARIVERLLSRGFDETGADALIAAVDGIGTRATLEPELWPANRQRETLARLIRPLLSS